MISGKIIELTKMQKIALKLLDYNNIYLSFLDINLL